MKGPADNSTYAVAAYIREYLDPDKLLTDTDDPVDVVAGMDLVFAEDGGCGVTVEQMAEYLSSLGPQTYESAYAGRFHAAYLVHTAREIFAWTETHPYTRDAEWPVDVYQNTGDPNEDAFILAVPTPDGLVAFFAADAEEANTIRESVF